MTTVRESTFDVLREHGMQRLFANPGSTEVALLGGVVLSLGPGLPPSGYVATLIFLCYVGCRLVGRYRKPAARVATPALPVPARIRVSTSSSPASCASRIALPPSCSPGVWKST